jgi:NTE family protein
MKVLILGGGGTLGAFSAGALRALEAEGWRADACIASSAGGINLLRASAGGAAKAEHFWRSLDWKWLLRDTLRRPPFHAVLDAKSFRARVEEGVRWEELFADPRPLGFIVVDLVTGRVCVRGNRTEPDVQSLRAVAHASYALPPLLPPIRNGAGLLADGGLLRNAPLEFALDLGATEIVYLCNVQVAPPADFGAKQFSKAFTRYAEVYFRRASNIGYADAPIVEGRYHGVPFLTIAPPRRLDLRELAGSMVPTTDRMNRLIELGAASARDALRSSYRIGCARTSMLDAELGPASVGVRRVASR